MPENDILDRPVSLPWLIAFALAPLVGAYGLVSEYLAGTLFLGTSRGGGHGHYLQVAEHPETAKWLVIGGILALTVSEIIILMKLNRFIRKTGEYSRPNKTQEGIGEELAKPSE